MIRISYSIILYSLLAFNVVIAQDRELTPRLTGSGVVLEDRVNEPGFSFVPRLTVSEVFSDNIALAPSDAKRSEFVTTIEPGFSAAFNGNRLDFNFDYTIQNLIYARDSEFNDTNHQLDLAATAEFFRDRLFLDVDGSLSQQSINSEDQLVDDNIALSDDRSDVTVFSLSPYYTNDFSGYAETEVRYTYGIVRFSENDSSDAGSEDASDSEENRLDIKLVSGRRADRTTWGIDYFKQEIDRDDDADADSDTETNDSERERLEARVNYRLSPQLQASARGGFEDNDLASQNNDGDVENGSFWSVGGVWTPSRFFELETFYGPSDNEITVRLAPTTRTSIELSRSDRDVGADTGEIFSGSLEHRTRYTVWTAQYTEETTSTQELEFDNLRRDDGLLDEDGQAILPGDSDAQDDLTDEEFFRKRLDFSFAYSRGRSVITVDSFFEDREFDSDTPDEQTIGGGARWVWTIGEITDSFIDLRWERNESGDTLSDSDSTQTDGDSDDNLWRLGVGLQRNFTERVNGEAEYSYARRDSDDPTEDYRENRVTLLLRMEF